MAESNQGSNMLKSVLNRPQGSNNSARPQEGGQQRNHPAPSGNSSKGSQPSNAQINQGAQASTSNKPARNVNAFSDLVEQAFKEFPSSSDLLIKEGNPIWARQHGKLTATQGGGSVTRAMLQDFINASASKIGHNWDDLMKELEVRGDVDFATDIKGSRFRFNYYKANGGRHCMALRRLPEKIVPLESLNLHPKFVELFSQEKGLILVTGPTGSGKSTTMASAIDYLNKTTSGHIITLEDPVEYIIKSDRCLVDQREIGKDAKDFKSGLRSALRQDPDILFVGELRDQETVKVAMDAATTGHLVLGTLHTNSAQQTIERVTSFFSDDRKDWAYEVLSQVILGISSQILLKKKDGSGRVMASEILIATPSIRSLIRDKSTVNIFNQMDTGSKEGQVLLNRALIQLVKQNVIDLDDAKFSTYNLKNLETELARG